MPIRVTVLSTPPQEEIDDCCLPTYDACHGSLPVLILLLFF